ncbi:MAG: hypothetical protein ACTSU5_12680 [Promethearchaeota archaeon]
MGEIEEMFRYNYPEFHAGLTVYRTSIVGEYFHRTFRKFGHLLSTLIWGESPKGGGGGAGEGKLDLATGERVLELLLKMESGTALDREKLEQSLGWTPEQLDGGLDALVALNFAREVGEGGGIFYPTDRALHFLWSIERDLQGLAPGAKERRKVGRFFSILRGLRKKE